MTPPDWASKKALKVWHSHRGGLSDYGARLLRLEHARAVRVVEKAFPDNWCHPYMPKGVTIGTMISPKDVELLLVRIQTDILHKLKEGRT